MKIFVDVLMEFFPHKLHNMHDEHLKKLEEHNERLKQVEKSNIHPILHHHRI